MYQKNTRSSLPERLTSQMRQGVQQVRRYWFQTTMIAVCSYALAEKDVQIGIRFGETGDAIPVVQWRKWGPQPARLVDGNLANTYSNMIYSQSGPKMSEKTRKQIAYVEAYADIARQEMQEYGIPASITLAQGLLESNAGESRLADQNHNHFGIKCFSKTCAQGHCRNFTDDHHKDFFRIYTSPEESYRAHSVLLQSRRYQHLQQLDPTDYKRWAQGLKKAGYATDPDYAEKLIAIIEHLQLHTFDE